VTVMIPRFFGVPQEVIRSGLLRTVKEGEVRLYLALMERSEYYCTREITLTDQQIRGLVGAAPRTLCDARKKLQELGLIQYRKGGGNRYTYVICDPATNNPYPGDPKATIPYQKKAKPVLSDMPAKPAPRSILQSPKQDAPPEAYGLPLKW
jgi:hypothetical protein